MRREDALIVLAKVPRPGKVKTRLCPPLAPADAAALSSCMLSDTVSEMAALTGARRYLFLDRPAGAGSLQGASFRSFEPRRQTGRDLGERMARAVRTAFREGAAAVVVVGADCPSLAAATVRRAFRELRAGAEAVFCPTEDGGFCLAGLAAPEVRIFGGITWSTSSVLSDVAARCRALGMPYVLLPPERDVDAYDDLVALQGWMAAHRFPRCPRTRAWLTAFRASRARGFPGRRSRTGSLPRGARSRRAG